MFELNKVKKVAFYVMNIKGYFVLKNFIEEFGGSNISYVVSAKDDKIKKDYFSEIKELVNKKNIVFFEKDDDYEDVETSFSGLKFAVGWRWIIKNCNNLIVLHDSLLPRYRGFAPLVNSLINGDKEIGVTALFATKEYDKGDIILQRKVTVDYPIKIYKAIKLIEPLYFELIAEIYRKTIKGEKIKGILQDDKKATYSPWLNEEDYFINWSWTAKKIKRFIDAVGYPYDNAKSYLNRKIVKIVDAEEFKELKIEDRNRHIGKVIFFHEGYPVVICGKGLIKIKDIRGLDNRKINIKLRSRFK